MKCDRDDTSIGAEVNVTCKGGQIFNHERTSTLTHICMETGRWFPAFEDCIGIHEYNRFNLKPISILTVLTKNIDSPTCTTNRKDTRSTNTTP